MRKLIKLSLRLLNDAFHNKSIRNRPEAPLAVLHAVERERGRETEREVKYRIFKSKSLDLNRSGGSVGPPVIGPRGCESNGPTSSDR